MGTRLHDTIELLCTAVEAIGISLRLLIQDTTIPNRPACAQILLLARAFPSLEAFETLTR